MPGPTREGVASVPPLARAKHIGMAQAPFKSPDSRFQSSDYNLQLNAPRRALKLWPRPQEARATVCRSTAMTCAENARKVGGVEYRFPVQSGRWDARHMDFRRDLPVF